MSVVQEQPIQNENRATLPLTFWRKFFYGALVIAAPIFNFIFIELMKPEWQTGKTSDYINLFLLPEASLWFFPLLAYSVISYILLLWDADHYGRAFIIRLGIYSGVILALQYSVLTILALEPSPLLILVIVAYLSPILIPRPYGWLISKWDASLIRNIALGIGFVIFLIAMIIWRNVLSPFIFLTFFLGIVSPFWSFLIAGQAARWLFKQYEIKFSIFHGLGLFAWISAYVFALRFNILKMFELYAALPTEPPNCYIATAAANGHPRFVGSQTVQLENGKSMQVNRQLQRLKAAEIAMMAVSATGHRMMRRIYDVIGKRLAAHIQNPLPADVAYLLLIPMEWISFFVLKLAVPEIKNVSERLYRS